MKVSIKGVNILNSKYEQGNYCFSFKTML